MNSYIFGLLYTLIGLLGAFFHWVKKRYVDDTTTSSFWQYLTTNKKATFQALFAIIGAEVGLSLDHLAGVLSLGEVAGAFTVGYTADSYLNRDKEEKV